MTARTEEATRELAEEEEDSPPPPPPYDEINFNRRLIVWRSQRESALSVACVSSLRHAPRFCKRRRR